MTTDEMLESAKQYSSDFIDNIYKRMQSEGIDNVALSIVFGMCFVGFEKFKNPKIVEDVKKVIDIICEESEKIENKIMTEKSEV